MENFNSGLDKGLPKDDREVDKYLERMAKHNSCLIQWLEDFKGKYGEYEQAQVAIKDAESALQKYKEKIGPMLVKVAVAKAIDARAKDGSPLVNNSQNTNNYIDTTYFRNMV